MADSFPQHWFLDLQGKRVGPFSPEQVLGLLADGEIPEGLTLFAAGPDGRIDPSSGITASAMRDAYFTDDRIPSAEPADAMGVPQATEQDPDSSQAIPVAREEPDHEAAANLATARRLFDLFQSARERRAKFSPAAPVDLAKLEDEPSRLMAWLRRPVGIAVAASVFMILGVQFFFNRSSSLDGTQRELAQSRKAVDSKVRPAASRESADDEDADSAEESDDTGDSETVAAPIRPSAPPRPVAKIQNNWRPAPRTAAPEPHTAVAGSSPRLNGRPFNKPLRSMPPGGRLQPGPQRDQPDPVAADEGDGDSADSSPNEQPQADRTAMNPSLPPEQPFVDPNGRGNGESSAPDQPAAPVETYQVE